MQTERKTIGTFRVEGMLQGAPPAGGGDYQGQVDAWVAAARSKGLGFSLDRSGGQVSVLADDRPVSSSALSEGGGVSESLQAIFESLLECFPMQHRMELFSTFRSVEYLNGAEVQTIYAVAPPGTIQMQKREVDAETVAPAPQLTGAGRLKVALLGLLTLVVLGTVAALVFMPQLKKAATNLSELKADDLVVDAVAYDGFITIEKEEVHKGKGGLVVDVTRGEKWAALIGDEAANVPAGIDWNTMLVAQSLRRGYVRCEIFDAEDKLLGVTELRLKGLLGKDAKEVSTSLIALPSSVRPKTIRLVH